MQHDSDRRLILKITDYILDIRSTSLKKITILEKQFRCGNLMVELTGCDGQMGSSSKK